MRKAIRRRPTDINFRKPEALRSYTGIESEGGGIHVRVAALLELEEAVPAQPKRIDQVGRKDVHFADREVVSHCWRDTKPRIQLRTAPGAGSAARKLVFARSVKVSGRKRVGIRDLVVDLKNIAIGRLLAAIFCDELTRQPQHGILSQNVETQLIRSDSLPFDQRGGRLNLRLSRSIASQRCAETKPAAVIARQEECAIVAVVNVRYFDRAADRSAEFVPIERRDRLSSEVLEEVCGVKRLIAIDFIERTMELVRSAADDYVHHATGILSRVGTARGDYADFLNRIERQPGGSRRRVSAFID